MKCTECGHNNERNRAKCDRCNEQLGSGYPNVNVYSDNYFQNGLTQRYNEVKETTSSATEKKVISLFENIVKENARIIINMDKALLFEIVNNDEPYLPYRRAVEQGKRLLSKINNDHKRTVVDNSFYGSHGADIVFGALGLDDNGLISYGNVSISLNEQFVGKRVSVFERNSFDLYDALTKDFKWNPANFPPPTGHFAIWKTKHYLALVKCHSQLIKEVNASNFPKILLKSDGDRSKDEFIEIHIYNKITYLSFSKIKLHTKLTDKKDQIAWAIAVEKLENEPIEVEEK